VDRKCPSGQGGAFGLGPGESGHPAHRPGVGEALDESVSNVAGKPEVGLERQTIESRRILGAIEPFREEIGDEGRTVLDGNVLTDTFQSDIVRMLDGFLDQRADPILQDEHQRKREDCRRCDCADDCR